MGRPSGGYTLKNGEKIPGVTTIIGRFKDSGALIQWAYKQGREHEGLSRRGLPAPSRLYEQVEQAALAGTIAHDLIEASILNHRYAPPSNASSDVLKRASNAFEQYQRWAAQTHIRIVATEKSMVSELHRFGGTIDAIGQLDQKIVLLDWKSSNAVYGEYLIQLAAYALLLEECEPALTPKGFHILRIAKESADFTHYQFGEIDDAREAFLLMREMYDLDKKIVARVK
jgi:hypothetical protein